MSQTPTFAIGVLAEALPEGRSLTIGECAHAAEAAASVYDLDSLVDFEKGERTYTQLWRTPYSEAYAIGWKQAGDTGFHDHDGSVGAVHVVCGTVAEEHIVLRSSGDWLARVEFPCGETFRFDGAHIHRMRHASGEIALTVHVYSPPLGRAGAYELACDGTLRRHSIAGDEELRASDTFQEHRAVEDPLRARFRRACVVGGRRAHSEMRLGAGQLELDAHGRLAARLAPDAYQRRPHGGRGVAVRLLGAQGPRPRLRDRELLEAEGVVATGVHDVEAGQGERLQRGIVLMRPVAGELAHARRGIGRERDQLTRGAAGAVARLAAARRLLEDRRDGSGRVQGTTRPPQLGDGLVQ